MKKRRDQMRDYIRAFKADENGMETIEFVIILAVVTGLIAIVFSVYKNVKGKAEGAEQQINTVMNQIQY